MRDFKEARDLREFIPIEIDKGLINQGYRVPLIGVKIDLIDLVLIILNILALIACIIYVMYKRARINHMKEIELEIIVGLQAPYFSTVSMRKPRTGKHTHEQPIELKC